MDSFIVSLIAYAIVGVFAGIVGGLLGISGGFLTIPCLIVIFHMMDFPLVYMMQLAIGTSLAAMVFNSLAAAYSHYKRNGVRMDIVKHSLPGLIIGSILGAFFGHHISGILLQMLFGVFALIAGVYLFRYGPHALQSADTKARSPTTKIWNVFGLGIGIFASLIGIGGGIVAVPIFAQSGLSMKQAVGTGSFSSLVVSFFGALSYLVFGLGETFYDHTIGYIYVPAFIVLAITTFLFAPVGARLTHVISNQRLKKYFSVVLMAVGLLMLVR